MPLNNPTYPSLKIRLELHELYKLIGGGKLVEASYFFDNLQDSLSTNDCKRLTADIIQKGTVSFLSENNIEKAENLLFSLKNKMDTVQFNQLKYELARKKIPIFHSILDNNIEEAEEFFQGIKDDLNQFNRKDLFTALINKKIEWIKVSMENSFETAECIFERIKPDLNYEQQEYLSEILQKKRREIERKELQIPIRKALVLFDFIKADQLYQMVPDAFPDYFRVKAGAITEYLNQELESTPILEQSLALSGIQKNLLIMARAGSGKTSVMTWKTSLLIDRYKENPDHILVLAFNGNAADEIRDRIRRKAKQPGFDNARTFHSLAHQLVLPRETLLYDEKDDVITQKMSLFVQNLLKEQIRNPVFIEKMFSFFRTEMREVERAGFFLNEKDYFDFRRNLLQITLNGEKVKSIGEKIIADYLFEHNISYLYEKVWLWGSQIYRPDFSIYEQQRDYVIEHWGIDEKDQRQQVPQGWSRTWMEYYAEMQTKRAYWKDKSVILIETSIVDLHAGRDVFEKILENRLREKGLLKKKLTPKDLIQKIQEKDYTITRMAGLFAQFIQRAKKKMLKAADVQALLVTYVAKDEREAIFLDLASRVYIEYEQALLRNPLIDFDDLMGRAIDLIHASQGKCAIALGNSKNRYVRMNDLEWILIDEYQDFSQQFFELISAIQKYNPKIKLFCVGDDWQAINGFAGSDLQYFNKYQEWVQDAQVAHLLYNFRSQAEIIRTGNVLMQGQGRPAESLPQNDAGDVHIEYMENDSWIELRNDENKSGQKSDDERFVFTESGNNGKEKKNIRVVASKYLKKCYQIITHPDNQGKSIAVLSRTNRIDGVRLNDFKNKLIACFSPAEFETIGDLKQVITIKTAHKFKGQEADLVIIMGACDGSFPLLHPDNALFEVFGRTMVDAFQEERRLFYVAITRAKSSLYIITEKDRESVFLKQPK